MRSKAGIFLVVVLIVALAVVSPAAQDPTSGRKKLTLERLYSFPRLEGTAPRQPKWSDDGNRVAFLWNDEGMPFRDLWVFDVENGKRTRLTRLPHDPDEWTTPASHKDKKLKKYLRPANGLRSFEWAPDSQQLTFAFRGEIYLVRADGSAPVRRLTRTKGGERNPKFSPGSERLGFVSGGELHVRHLQTGETVQLTTNGGLDIEDEGQRHPGHSPGRFEWSPDGKWIAFAANDSSGFKGRLIPNYSGERVKAPNQNWRIAREGNSKTRLGVVPSAGGNTVWLTKKSDDYFYDWEWSPDGKAIATTRVEENQKNRSIDVIDVAAAIAKHEKDEEDKDKKGTTEDTEKENAEKKNEKKDKNDKKDKKPEWIRTLYSETDEKWICSLCQFVVWSPDSQQVLFGSERDGWNHLYLVAAAGSGEEPRQLTKGEWEVERRGAAVDMTPSFSPDGQTVYFTANKTDPSERNLFRILAAGGEVERITAGKGYSAAILSSDGKHMAFLYSSFAQPWDLYIKETNPAVSAVLTVTQSPLPEFAEYEWPQPAIFDFPARDGKNVRGLVFFPPLSLAVDVTREMRTKGRRNRPSGKRKSSPRKPPVINFVHGAGYAQAVLNRWGGYLTERFHFNQFVSQQGYLVIDVDYRGSSGYGRDWRTDVYLHLGGLDLEDEMAAMDHVGEQGWGDTGRAGVWGVSYGGFMTLMVMFNEPDAFRAGSAWASVTDWENYNRGYTQQRLRTPEDEPEAYKKSSPIHHVEGLKGKLQLVHGVVDPNVHFQDIMQLTDALVYAGKPFTQQFYPQSVHGWARPQVWIHSTRSMFQFFEEHVKGKGSEE